MIRLDSHNPILRIQSQKQWMLPTLPLSFQGSVIYSQKLQGSTSSNGA